MYFALGDVAFIIFNFYMARKEEQAWKHSAPGTSIGYFNFQNFSHQQTLLCSWPFEAMVAKMHMRDATSRVQLTNHSSYPTVKQTGNNHQSFLADEL